MAHPLSLRLIFSLCCALPQLRPALVPACGLRTPSARCHGGQQRRQIGRASCRERVFITV